MPWPTLASAPSASRVIFLAKNPLVSSAFALSDQRFRDVSSGNAGAHAPGSLYDAAKRVAVLNDAAVGTRAIVRAHIAIRVRIRVQAVHRTSEIRKIEV